MATTGGIQAYGCSVMFGDQPVPPLDGEVPLHEVVHAGPGTLPTTLPHGREPELLLRAQPPNPANPRRYGPLVELIHQQVCAQAKVVGVGVGSKLMKYASSRSGWLTARVATRGSTPSSPQISHTDGARALGRTGWR